MTKKLLILTSALVLVLAACGGDDSGTDSGSGGSGDSGDSASAAPDSASGEEIFKGTCVACHGPGGEGIDGLGKPLPGSAFIAGLSDTDLADFIKTGRSTSDPANTTGVDMPPKGGNPSLSEQDIVDVVAYIRTIQ